MTTWKRASVRLACGCVHDIPPAQYEEFAPTFGAECSDHGETTVVRCSRIGQA